MHFSSPQSVPAAPGGSLNDPCGHVSRVFYNGFGDLAEKPSHLSSRMAIYVPTGVFRFKKVRPSRAKSGCSKNMHPLCVRITTFAPEASQKFVPRERGEVEGRFAL